MGLYTCYDCAHNVFPCGSSLARFALRALHAPYIKCELAKYVAPHVRAFVSVSTTMYKAVDQSVFIQEAAKH
jgi:hypothetical protein